MSFPTSADAIAALIADVGFVTWSVLRSTTDVVDDVILRTLVVNNAALPS